MALLPGHQTFRAFPAVLSRIAAFSSAGGFGMCLPQFFHTNTGHHEKVGTTWPPRHSRKSASRGVPNFGDLSVRSRYGPPGCSLPGLIWTRENPCPPGAFTSGLPTIGSPQWLPDMTTVPYWDLHRRNLHPRAQQLASLRHLHRYYGVVRLLLARSVGLWSPSTTRYLHP